MICWDVQYADPARGLALRGAEMILMPIWGGNEALGKARAIENQVFLVTSGYDYPNYAVDPDGGVLAHRAGTRDCGDGHGRSQQTLRRRLARVDARPLYERAAVGCAGSTLNPRQQSRSRKGAVQSS